MKKVLSLFLSLLLVLSSATIAFGQPSDYANSWAKTEIDYMIKKDILNGYPDGTFRPEDNMSKSEFYKVINHLVGFKDKAEVEFKDVLPTDWYYEEALKGVAAGYLNPEVDLNARENISRGEVAKIISIIFGVEENKEKAKEFEDYLTFPKELRGIIGGLLDNGLITGYEDNTFKPNNTISRSEVVKMLHNISGQIVNKRSFVYKDVEGNILISAADTTLKNMVVDGNVYLTAGIGEGDISLDGVEIKGELNIQGGGSNSITITNSKINKISISKQSKEVRVVIDNSQVEEIKTSKKVRLELKKGTKVKSMELEGEVVLVIEKGAEIENLIAKSEDIKIESKGTIKTLNAEETIILNGKKVDKGTIIKDKVISTPSTGGSGSGGSSNGGGTTPDPETPEEITIKSINDVADVLVEYGTSQADALAKLATTTTIIDSQDQSHTVNLDWELENYDGNTAGDYIGTGTFELPEGVSQSDPAIELEIEATITVKEKVVEPEPEFPNLSVSPESVVAAVYFNETFTLTISNDTVTRMVYSNDISLGGSFRDLNIGLVSNINDTTITAEVYGRLIEAEIGTIELAGDVLEISEENLVAEVDVYESAMNFTEDPLLGEGFGLGELVIYKAFANIYPHATHYSVNYSVGSSSTVVQTEIVKLDMATKELIQYKEGINTIDVVLYDASGNEIATVKDIMKK